MRKFYQSSLNSGIYARLRDVQMSEADRQDAVKALHQAEQIADLFLWVREKATEIGHAFMKPSLRH